MARRNTDRGGRGAYTPTSNGTLPRISIRPLSALTLYPSETLSQTLYELEDRRTYRPDYSVRAPASQRRRDARLIQDPTQSNLRRITFANPTHVAMCLRRKIRREVLHALKVAGGKGFKKPRRNAWSDIGC